MKKKHNRKLYWCHSHFLNWMGSSNYIFEVIKILIQKYQVIVVASVFSDEARRKFSSIGVKTISLNNKSTNSISYWLNLNKNIYLESEKLGNLVNKSDIIVTSMFPMNCIAARLKNGYIQCCWEPYALFYDKNYISGFKWYEKIAILLFSYLYRPLDLESTRKAKRIITLSDYHKKLINRIYGRDDSLISYEGVDTDFFRRTANSDLKKKYGNTKIIFHSTDFTATKGTEFLIHSLPKILRSFSNSKLLISNTMDDFNKKWKFMLYAKEHGFTRNIVFLGRINYKMLPAYYSLADVVVQPSIMQNMSLPVKEAMSCGTPIVTLKEGFEQTPNGKAGFLVDSKNSDEIANAVIKIFKNASLAKNMGMEGRKIILSRFKWEGVAKVYEKAINSV